MASSGNSTKSNSFTYAGVDGNNTNIQSREAGTATGVGNSQVNATGDAYMANGNLTNLYSKLEKNISKTTKIENEYNKIFRR